MENSDFDSTFPWGDIEKNWKWHLFLGFFFVAAGSIGLVITPLTTITSVILFGVFLLAGGIFQLIEALRNTKGWKGRMPHTLGGIFYILAGFLTLINPVAASMALTLLLGASLFLSAIVKIVIAFQHKGEMQGWIFLLLSGLASLVIAIIIAVSWPFSALWTLGLFLSIDMLLSGWSHILIALAAKRISSLKKA